MSKLANTFEPHHSRPASVHHDHGRGISIQKTDGLHKPSVNRSSDTNRASVIARPALLTPLPATEATPDGSHEAVLFEDLQPRVEQELQRILASKTFQRSPRLRRMLEFVVRQYLAGAGEYLKEYTLGVEVFERGVAFDPRSDPIVRVEASRLRKQVQCFYATVAKDSDLRIEIPKGGYTPLIRMYGSTVPALRENKTIAIPPFSVMCTGNDDARLHASAVRLRLTHLLTKVPRLRVLSQFWSHHHAAAMEPGRIGDHFGVDLVLDGTLVDLSGQCYLFAFLASVRTGHNIWSEDVCLEGPSTVNVADRMAKDICSTLVALDAE